MVLLKFLNSTHASMWSTNCDIVLWTAYRQSPHVQYHPRMQPAMSPYHHVYAINRPMSGPSRVAGQQNLRQNTLAKQRASPIHNFQHTLYEQHIGTSPKNIESATASPPPPLIGSKPQRHQIIAATSSEFAGYTTVDVRRCLHSITIIIAHLLYILIFAWTYANAFLARFTLQQLPLLHTV